MNAPPIMNGGQRNDMKQDKKVKAVLVLQDGTRYEGYSFGAMTNTSGEIGKMIYFTHNNDKWGIRNLYMQLQRNVK